MPRLGRGVRAASKVQRARFLPPRRHAGVVAGGRLRCRSGVAVLGPGAEAKARAVIGPPAQQPHTPIVAPSGCRRVCVDPPVYVLFPQGWGQARCGTCTGLSGGGLRPCAARVGGIRGASLGRDGPNVLEPASAILCVCAAMTTDAWRPAGGSRRYNLRCVGDTILIECPKGRDVSLFSWMVKYSLGDMEMPERRELDDALRGLADHGRSVVRRQAVSRPRHTSLFLTERFPLCTTFSQMCETEPAPASSPHLRRRGARARFPLRTRVLTDALSLANGGCAPQKQGSQTSSTGSYRARLFDRMESTRFGAAQ